MSIFAHFYGIATYSDETNAIFETMIDDKGNIYTSDEAVSADAIAQVNSQQGWIQDMLDLLSSNIPTVNGKRINSNKTVTNLVAKLHGRVSKADGTWEDFSVQYDPQIGEFVPNSGDVDAWNDAYSGYQSELDSMFKTVNNDTSVF